RCSVVEHHAEVDCGTVLEDTTVLPYTYVGSSLDASHTILGFGAVAHLRRNTEVEISDPRLLGTVASSASWRTMKTAASLVTYLPTQAMRGLLAGGRRTSAPLARPADGLNGALGQAPSLEPSSEPVSASNQTPPFAGDFAVVRRYGNE
ncbi:MAG TPA: hypothetical protein VKT29_00420, partial [Terriglobales bacterium]|nr:hypothetical protein [Terriglobales bacterium]